MRLQGQPPNSDLQREGPVPRRQEAAGTRAGSRELQAERRTNRRGHRGPAVPSYFSCVHASPLRWYRGNRRISHAAFLAGRRIYVGRCVEAVRVPQAGRRTAARVHPIVSMEALSLLASPPLGAARAVRSRRAVSTPAERSGEFVTRRCKSGRKADESPCFSHVAQRFSDAANGISRHRVGVPARVRSLCHLWLIAGGGAACVHLARCRFAEQQACQQQSQCA